MSAEARAGIGHPSAGLHRAPPGLVARASGANTVAEASWGWTGAAGLVLSVWWVAQTACERKLGVDAVAVLALAGALSVGEYLAGALITVMLATGRSLERWAAGRAERDLHALLRRSPTVVHRYHAGALVDAPVGDVVRAMCCSSAQETWSRSTGPCVPRSPLSTRAR